MVQKQREFSKKVRDEKQKERERTGYIVLSLFSLFYSFSSRASLAA
jgi:cytochrome c1